MAQAQADNTVYLTHLNLKGIRAFKDFTLNFTNTEGKPRMRTLIVGRNGTNKTTVLRCIVLGLVPYGDALGLLGLPNGRFVNHKHRINEITSHFCSRESSEHKKSFLVFVSEHNSKNFREGIRKEDVIDYSHVDEYHRNIFIVAYGTSRSMIGFDSSREYRAYDSVQSLFHNEARLHSTELTLRRMQDYKGTDVYKSAIPRIIKALQLLEETTITLPKGGGIEISGPAVGEAIPIEGWADGYRLTFQWVIDLYAWAMRAGQITEDGGIRGILLIDEIEQHLHPSLQTGLLDKLSELFPELQIIATTHSPMVALGAKPEELVVLKREGDKVVAVEKVPDFRHYSIEDMVHDDLLFDSPVYSLQLEKTREEYRQLAQKSPQSRSPSEEEKLASLARQITPPPPENADDILQEIKRMREEIEK